MSDLLTIRTNVRRNLGEATARFYTTTELNQFIGEAYRKYTLLMIQEGDGYFVDTNYFAIVANDPNIDLTTTDLPFFNVSQFWKVTSFGFNPLKQDEKRFSPNYTYVTGTGDQYMPTWRLKGMNLVLQPTPTFSEAITSTSGLKLDYSYLPDFPNADSDDDFEMDNNFSTVYEPLVELYATIAALESKDGMGGVSDIQSFRDRRVQWEQTFMDTLQREEQADTVSYQGMNYFQYY